ncbi:hypothetical protein QL285_033703 [Trifolium repens]|nr:hypothetical protein QL285_033703 [Trifolium repens]
MRNLELTLGVTILIQQLYLHFNLEDKVGFKGDGNVMINDALTSCLFINMLCIEEIICGIKVVEVEMMERIRHKKMLLSSSWSDALEFYHVQIMDPLEVDSLNSQIFLTEVVKKSIWTICNQFLISCAHFKQWDLGQQLEMCKTMWSFKFKQWDPGKICAKCSFYNLEDKSSDMKSHIKEMKKNTNIECFISMCMLFSNPIAPSFLHMADITFAFKIKDLRENYYNNLRLEYQVFGGKTLANNT